MTKEYPGVDEKILQRWNLAAKLMGIPGEAYDMPVKIVRDKTRKSNYTFGVIYSPYRGKRPSQSIGEINCHMCRMSKEAEENPVKNLLHDRYTEEFIVTPNSYPPHMAQALQ